MKKCNKIIASLLAGVLLVSSVGVLPTEASDSDATVLIQEDFEGEKWNDFVIEDVASDTVTMNTYSGGGTMTHNSRSTSHINATITDDVDNKVLTITENSMKAARNIYFTYADGKYCDNTDKPVFQFSLKDAATSFGEFSCKIEGQNSNDKATPVTLLTVKNGTLTLNNTNASYELSEVSWTTVRVAVDFSNKTYDIYVGDDAFTNITSDTFSTLKNMKWFRFDISSGTNSGAIKIDNVALYQADEVVKDAFAEPTAIQLDQTEIHLNVNDTTTLTPTITTDGFEPAVTWTTNDETIATVNNGVVTAVAAGTATITATAGDVSAECNVSIRKELIKENFAGEEWNDFVIEDVASGTVTMNTYSGDGTMTHNSRSTSHINATITDDVDNKVLTITENSMNAARNIYFTYADGKYCANSDKLVFQFSLKDTATPFGEFSCKIEGQNANNVSKPVALLTVTNGTLTLSNTTAPSYNLSKDSWTTVRVAVDFSTKTYDVYIGENAHTDITLPTIKNMKWFRFDISSGTNSGAIKVDNIALYQASELHDDIFYTTVDGTNLTLDDGNIGIKYHVNTDNLLSTKTDKMQFTMDGEVTEVVNTDGQYIFKYGVPAKMMTETITAQLVDANGKALMYPVEYSIQDNALAIINGAEENTDYEAAAPLAKAMLNYGAYAQQYFGVNTDNLANAGVETDIISVTADSLLAYTGSDYASVTGDTSIGSLVGTVVTLESNTYLKYYFLLNSSLSVDDLTFTDGNDNQLKATTNNGYCEVVIEGIKATDLNTPYTVNVTNGTQTLSAKYCVMTNIYKVLAASKGTYDESHINVCKALYLYNVAADAYFPTDTE